MVTFSIIFTVLWCPSGEAQILPGRVLLDNVNTVQGSMLAAQDHKQGRLCLVCQKRGVVMLFFRYLWLSSVRQSHQTLLSLQSITGPRGKHSYTYSISWAGWTQYRCFCMTIAQDLFSACWWKVGHSVEGRTRFRERKKGVRWGNLVLWSSEDTTLLKFHGLVRKAPLWNSWSLFCRCLMHLVLRSHGKKIYTPSGQGVETMSGNQLLRPLCAGLQHLVLFHCSLWLYSHNIFQEGMD